MGKINLNAMKQARKEQEIETPVPEALEQAYANVWGKDKETVQYIELNHIVPFTDKAVSYTHLTLPTNSLV